MNYRILSIFTVGFLLSFQLLWAQSSNNPSGEPGVASRAIHQNTGVELVFVLEDGMFPETWYNAEIDATAEPLDRSEVERVIKIVNKCLEKYPEQLIKENLNQIYILKSLEFFGTSYGGTYTSNAVYLSDKGVRRGYTDEYIEKVFHAEFSSILYQNFQSEFDSEAWKNSNQEGCTYGNGGMLALKTGNSSEDFIEEYNDAGFLNQYAQSSLENDFNSFAKNLFCPTRDFWAITSKHENLGKKLDIIIAFYLKIHPRFDLAFFRRLTEN